jgi:hypothetical protein
MGRQGERQDDWVSVAEELADGRWLAEPFDQDSASDDDRVATAHSGRAKMQAQGPDQRSAMADGSWMAWTAAGIAGIWVAVALISIFARDMVSGSEQEHLSVAAFVTWIWGLVATGAFLWTMGRPRGNATRRPVWIGLSVTTVAVWLVAAILSITLPVFETGSDPTRLPIGAMVAPVAAAMLTIVGGITAGVFAGPPADT